MAPKGNDCFYVLVPVPNNQSKIDWSIEGVKMKNLVIDKMEKDLMPNLRENIVEDFYLTPDYFENELNNDISYYLHRPTATDKSMAPPNHDCFYVLVPVPNNQSKIDWKIEGEKLKNLVIEKMQEHLLPNLKENIVEDFYLTPDYFENELNTKHGSGFSIQPKFTQSAYFRFHNKSEVYNGLYFVGAGSHPGAGVPGVLSSAKVLDKIL